jgi:hypothetical protein
MDNSWRRTARRKYKNVLTKHYRGSYAATHIDARFNARKNDATPVRNISRFSTLQPKRREKANQEREHDDLWT